MTTQNIEPENSDVNETVVQQSSASETPATPALAETQVATPANEQFIQTQTMETQTSEKQVDEESVRPFTDYIEEFRQTEVRFGSLLEEPQVGPFSSLNSGEEQGGSQFTPGWANTLPPPLNSRTGLFIRCTTRSGLVYLCRYLNLVLHHH